MPSIKTPPLILASRSKARQDMLRSAGLEFTAQAADLDEDDITARLLADKAAPETVALELARRKALAVSKLHENADPAPLVIGADQVLALGGELLGKAADAHAARQKLARLQGREHTLISAVCVVRGQTILWSQADEARLTMHDLESAFLDRYCAKAGEGLTRAVGAYELEGLGAWLFSGVKGDYYTVLGLPLLPLLGYLRGYQGFGP